ncbi:hypothetical protein [Paenibacillus silviterrae]|uniref:hypothetical protein n=2 Tax=Paenibacillus silviterrae TaxID=3242194 RepID=UPI002542EC02|nr:hypothetical protein [Paenibacillus chinjuensis]
MENYKDENQLTLEEALGLKELNEDEALRESYYGGRKSLSDDPAVRQEDRKNCNERFSAFPTGCMPYGRDQVRTSTSPMQSICSKGMLLLDRRSGGSSPRLCMGCDQQAELFERNKENVRRVVKMLNKAVEKLNTEIEKENKPYVTAIGNFLLQHLQSKPHDAEKILSQDKSIVKSLDAMRAVAEKNKVGNCAVLTDQEGFAIVLNYFGIETEAAAAPQEKRRFTATLDI